MPRTCPACCSTTVTSIADTKATVYIRLAFSRFPLASCPAASTAPPRSHIIVSTLTAFTIGSDNSQL
ncbi:hypothetical protein [Xylanibacter ruminicola]|uniref:hypothetical protein n=1 Tax=Xylanibacter ruminicola TaxID=839 RepID=UPI0011601902|nr:hypothetical protein [Xylanibacter ruminicola]